MLFMHMWTGKLRSALIKLSTIRVCPEFAWMSMSTLMVAICKVLMQTSFWNQEHAHVAKLREITGKTRVFYSKLGEITGNTRVLPGGWDTKFSSYNSLSDHST